MNFHTLLLFSTEIKTLTLSVKFLHFKCIHVSFQKLNSLIKSMLVLVCAKSPPTSCFIRHMPFLMLSSTSSKTVLPETALGTIFLIFFFLCDKLARRKWCGFYLHADKKIGNELWMSVATSSPFLSHESGAGSVLGCPLKPAQVLEEKGMIHCKHLRGRYCWSFLPAAVLLLNQLCSQ